MSNQIGENFLTNKQTVKNLYDAFYNYVTKKSVLRNPSSDLRTKLLSETGLAKEVKAIMDKNPDFEANPFINQLIFSTDPVQRYTFINVDNRRIKDDKNEIIEGWEELLNSPDPKIKEIGYKLVEYAAQSGTTYNLTSFFQYIPPTVFKSRPINIDVALSDDASIKELVEQTFRHNYKNKNLVRELATKIEFDKDNKQLIRIDNAYAVTKNGVSSPFVTTNPRNGITGLRSKKLYQLHQVYTDSFGKPIHVYKLTNTLGYSSKYGTVNEYTTNAPITLNKDSVVRNIEKINPVFLNNIAEFRLPIQPIKENPFKGKLIFAMSGTGKTTAMETNEDIVDAETYYKKLLNNDNIQEAERAIITDPTTGALNWDKIMPIRKLVANFVNEQLSQGKIVVSGLNFLAMQSERLGVKFDYAVILKDAELFKERISTRKDNPIILDNEIKKDNVILERKNLFNVTPIQSADKKAVIKASVATQYIGFGEGITGSSTELYRQQILKQSNKKIPKIGDIVTINFEIDYKNVEVKAKIINLEIYLDETISNKGFSVDLENIKTGKKYGVYVDTDGTISQFEGKGGLRIGTDNYIKEFNINSQKETSIVNSGNYSTNDVIFVSIGGKRGNEQIRKEQQDRTIKEALKAIENGATLITDNVNYIHYNSITKQQRPITMSIEEFRKENGLYNEGEKRLYENLKSKGYNYSEQTIDGQLLGVWKKENSIKNTNTLSYSDLYQRYFDRALQVAPNNLLSLSKNDYLADFLYGKLKIQKPSNTNLTNDTKSDC